MQLGVIRTYRGGGISIHAEYMEHFGLLQDVAEERQLHRGPSCKEKVGQFRCTRLEGGATCPS